MSIIYGSFDYETKSPSRYQHPYTSPEFPLAPILPSGPALSGAAVANSNNAAGNLSVTLPSASIPANTTVVVTIIAGSVSTQTTPCSDNLSNTYQNDLIIGTGAYVYSYHYTSAPGANVTITAECNFGQIVLVAQAYTGLAAANYVGTTANNSTYGNSTTWTTNAFAANYASNDLIAGFFGTYNYSISNATANSPYTIDQSLYGTSTAQMATYYLITTSSANTAANGNCTMTQADTYYAGAVEYKHA